MTVNDLIKTYIGKTLVGCEYEMNVPGCQTVTVPQKVIDAEMGVTEGDYDPCIWLTLENGERAYFYCSEEIYFK